MLEVASNREIKYEFWEKKNKYGTVVPTWSVSTVIKTPNVK